MALFKSNRNEDKYNKEIYTENNKLKEAIEEAKVNGNLFINVIKYNSLYSGDNVFKDNLSELREYIMSSASKILGFVESEYSIILYSNEQLDLIATATRALDETSTKIIIRDTDPSSLYILSLNLVIDFDKGIIKKIKRNILGCRKSYNSDNSSYNIVFDNDKVIESEEFNLEKDMPEEAKKALIKNPKNLKEFVKGLLVQ